MFYCDYRKRYSKSFEVEIFGRFAVKKNIAGDENCLFGSLSFITPAGDRSQSTATEKMICIKISSFNF
jgi:hypothetical protein